MGYHAFDWRAWSIKPENKKLIEENMAKAVNKFKREQWLWEAKYEYLTMAYHPSVQVDGQANAGAAAGTSVAQEVEIDLSAFATPRAVATMALTTGEDQYISDNGTLVFQEAPSVFRPVFKIYS